MTVWHRVLDPGVDCAVDLRDRHQRRRRGRRSLLHDQPNARHGVRRSHRNTILLRKSGKVHIGYIRNRL